MTYILGIFSKIGFLGVPYFSLIFMPLLFGTRYVFSYLFGKTLASLGFRDDVINIFITSIIGFLLQLLIIVSVFHVK